MPFGRSFTIDEATNRIDNEGYAYDNAGNMTDDTSHEYAYDAENRLVTVDGGTTATYSYDGDGQRVQKLALSGAEGSSGTLYWYGPGGEVLQETDGAGTLLRDFIYFNGQRVARREANNTVYFFFSDHLGSARVVTDASGGVVEESDFYPYGREIVITDLLQGSQDNPYKFTGQERDPETSLDYFGARHYGFTIGRFLQPDRFTPSADVTNPQSWNRYTYVLNNPLQFVDPLGLFEAPAYNCTQSSEACLNDRQREILEHSSVNVNGESLSGETLYNALTESQRSTFINVTDSLASITFSDGSTGLDFVRSISAFGNDRVFANVDERFVGNLLDSSKFAQVTAGAGGHGEFSFISFKSTQNAFGNIQLSFASDLGRVDIDHDLFNLAHSVAVSGSFRLGNPLAQAAHVLEVFYNNRTGQTTSQDLVRSILQDQGVTVTRVPNE